MNKKNIITNYFRDHCSSGLTFHLFRTPGPIVYNGIHTESQRRTKYGFWDSYSQQRDPSLLESLESGNNYDVRIRTNRTVPWFL